MLKSHSNTDSLQKGGNRAWRRVISAETTRDCWFSAAFCNNEQNYRSTTIRRERNSSQSSGLDEENRLQKGLKAFHPLRRWWHQFSGTGKEFSSLTTLRRKKSSLKSTTHPFWTDWRSDSGETSGSGQEIGALPPRQCTGPFEQWRSHLGGQRLFGRPGRKLLRRRSREPKETLDQMR